MNISVKFGTFNVVENKDNNGISIYNGDNKVLDIANINWWDKDAIENAMYAKESLIKERNKDYRDVKIESLNQAVEAMERYMKTKSISGKKDIVYWPKARTTFQSMMEMWLRCLKLLIMC